MNYEHDLMVIFWLAVDKLDIKVVNEIINYDMAFRHNALLALKSKSEMPWDFKPKKKEIKKAKKGFGNHEVPITSEAKELRKN